MKPTARRRPGLAPGWCVVTACLALASALGVGDASAAAHDKPDPQQMLFPQSGDVFQGQTFVDRVVYVRPGVADVTFVGCEFIDSTLKVVGGRDVRVLMSTWRGSHDTDQTAINLAGARGVLIDGCTLSDVQRGLLVISNSHGDNRDITLRRTVIRRWAQIDPDPNRNEAILVHGYGSGERYAVRNLVIDDVWVTEWPGVPLCVWECSVRGMTVRDFESDSPSPMRFAIARSRRTQTIDGVSFEWTRPRDPRYAARQMLAMPRLDMVVGPVCRPENWGEVRTPPQMTVRLHHVWGGNHFFLPGTYADVPAARLAAQSPRSLLKDLAPLAEARGEPIRREELTRGWLTDAASFD